MTGSRHARTHGARRARNVARAGIAAAVAVALGTAAALLVGSGGDSESAEVAGGGTRGAQVTTTTSSTTTTTTAPPPPQPIAPGHEPAFTPAPKVPAGPTSDTVADAVIVEEPPPPPPPPVTVTADLALVPVTMPLGYSMAAPPVLIWSTSGGASVVVTGPGLSSAAANGSAPICPGSSAAVCTAPPGTYTYNLVVEDAWGQVVAQRAATLTIV